MAIVAFDSKSVRTTPEPWQTVVRQAIRDPLQLVTELGLPQQLVDGTAQPHQQFSTFVPRTFLRRMVPGDPADPLLLQVLPRSAETRNPPDYKRDAVGELGSAHPAGLVRKYPGRALLITRGVCAVNCRYCFRRHFPYNEYATVGDARIRQAIEIIRADAGIEEIILSGGDPLMMVDDALFSLIDQVEAIEQIQRLRIHTRLPVVIPQRVTDALVRRLGNSRLTVSVVLHINHAQEIDQSVVEAAGRLQQVPLTLLNQSVLLRGVNDQVDTLVQLSRRLIEMHCLPYYLHQLDRVQGAAHFEVATETGETLIQEMRKQLPGYAVPRFVREVPGELSKSVIA